MSAKEPTHRTQVSVFEPRPINRAALLGFGFILLAVVALGFLMWQPEPVQVSSASESPAAAVVPYSNALEMQYAQPWLARAEAARIRAIPYGNALEMQYAQPWLARQAASVTRPLALPGTMEMQYAQPWLDANDSAALTTDSADDGYATYTDRYWEMAAQYEATRD